VRNHSLARFIQAAEAAELLRLTPTDLLKFGIIDDVITEPLGAPTGTMDNGHADQILYQALPG
jgi:acetyl-CoA carboxylase alpha subunit